MHAPLRTALVLALTLGACRGPGAGAPSAAPVRFGVIADVQYADKPDAGERRYSTSLARLREAVDTLNAEPDLAFVVQLGDLIDGRDGAEGSRTDLDAVLELFADLRAPLVHAIGNHCLEVPRDELLARLGLADAHTSREVGGWRFLAADSMAVSVAGLPAGDPRRAAAAAWLEAHPAEDWPEARPWNGALGGEQLAWIAGELAAARRAGQRVVLFAHHPLLAEAASAAALAWDHGDVLALLAESPEVALWFNGHAHSGGYAERDGVHHVTVQGMVEAPEGENAWAVVTLHPDRCEIRGAGTVPDRLLPIGRRPQP